MAFTLNEDGTFTEAFEQEFPQETRDYVRTFKDIKALVKAGLESRREFRSRVKIPDDPQEKEAFVDEHFKDVLDARSKKSQEAAQRQQAEAEEQARIAAEKKKTEGLEKAREAVKSVLGEKAEQNLELCRRALLGDHCPAWIRNSITTYFQAEKFEDVKPEQLTEILASDPAVVQTLLTIGTLTDDTRMEQGAGPRNTSDQEELYPDYPYQPQLYANREDNDPMKRYFINRGAKYEGGKYIGGFSAAAAS